MEEKTDEPNKKESKFWFFIGICGLTLILCGMYWVYSLLPINLHEHLTLLLCGWIIVFGVSFLLLGEGQKLAEIGLIGVFICFSIGIILYPALVNPFASTTGIPYNTSTHQPISSLSNKYTYSGGGSFLLGSGTVTLNGDPRYFYFKPLDGGYFTLDSIQSMGTLLKEDGGSDPNIEVITYHISAGTKTYVPWVGIFQNWTDTIPDQVTGSTTIIHVPNGTVIMQSFNPQVT